MTPRLTDLNGAPMTWDELARRVSQWHATHDQYGDPVTFVPVATCYRCTDRHHLGCTGRARAANVGPVECVCAQNGHVA